MGVASSFKKNWSDFVKNSLGVSYTIFKDNVAEMVRLSFPFELREVNDADYTITSYITTNTIDRYSTRVVPQGIKLESYEKLGKPVFFNHNFYQLPIGRNLWLKKDERGILAKTRFNPSQVQFTRSDEERKILMLYGFNPSQVQFTLETIKVIIIVLMCFNPSQVQFTRGVGRLLKK